MWLEIWASLPLEGMIGRCPFLQMLNKGNWFSVWPATFCPFIVPVITAIPGQMELLTSYRVSLFCHSCIMIMTGMLPLNPLFFLVLFDLLMLCKLSASTRNGEFQMGTFTNCILFRMLSNMMAGWYAYRMSHSALNSFEIWRLVMSVVRFSRDDM